jgi:hypothetical protein
MREALQARPEKSEPAQGSSFALGEELFGRYGGPKNADQPPQNQAGADLG